MSRYFLLVSSTNLLSTSTRINKIRLYMVKIANKTNTDTNVKKLVGDVIVDHLSYMSVG